MPTQQAVAAPTRLAGEGEAGTYVARPARLRSTDREAMRTAFFEWLPPEVRDAPNIEWEQVPPAVMGYLVRTVATAPWAAHLAVCAAVWEVRPRMVLTNIVLVHNLLRSMQLTCSLVRVEQLNDLEIWEAVLTNAPKLRSRSDQVRAYVIGTGVHLRTYFARLSEEDERRMTPYRLPQAPGRFLVKHGVLRAVNAETEQRRKARSDILVPLYPVLVCFIQWRHQAARRLIGVYRDVCRRVREEHLSLPYSFEYDDTSVELSPDARTIAQVRVTGRPVHLQFTLWDRRSWVLAHADTYGSRVLWEARRGCESYDAEHNTCFLEFTGQPKDLLWFGDLVADGLLHSLTHDVKHLEGAYRKRQQQARAFGATTGFRTSRAGLLSMDMSSTMFLVRARQTGSLLFDPDPLYRASLYGSALLLISLTNGARVNELLQVSCDRFRTRNVTVQVRQDSGRVAKQRTIYLQHLLPKGHHQESQRMLFPMSMQAMELLEEIAGEVRQAHGGTIPVVAPASDHLKYAELRPERYLFQWGATADISLGAVRPSEVVTLMRFVLHGLQLTTAEGEPIHVGAHLLRHVFATTARHQYHVPAEAVAWTLHHAQGTDPVTEGGHGHHVPTATEYYSQQTETQALEHVQEFHRALERELEGMELAVPDERDLQAMNEDLRTVFARWHTLHPTAFGFCGCPYLCPRGERRALCLGCSYLVPDPEKLQDVLAWQESYTHQAAELEEAGNVRDAAEVLRTIQDLADIANVMRLSLEAEAYRNYRPLFKTLLSGGAQTAKAND